MLHRLGHFVLDVSFNSATSTVQFHAFQYNRGKNRFKKRYELEMENTKSLDTVVTIQEVSWLPFELMVPLGILQNAASGTCLVIQFDFHRQSVQTLAEFVVHGRKEDVILLKGPTFCSLSQRTVLSNICIYDPTRIAVSSEVPLVSVQYSLLYSCDFREKDNGWVYTSPSKSTVSIPKPTPSSTLFHLLPLNDSEAYVLLEDIASFSVLFLSCGFAATIVSVADKFVSLAVTHLFGSPSLALQLAHSFYLIRSNSILFHTIDSFVLIDDFLSLGSPQFFCYSAAPSFPYTLCDSSHATLLADSLHGHHSTLSNAARNVFVHELSVRRTRLQEAFHVMRPVNDALQALLQGDVHTAKECLHDQTESKPHTEKRNKHTAVSIRSYRCERRGEALELHVTGDAGDLAGTATLQAAAQRASFQQFCDAFSLSSTFEATIRMVGACPSSLSLFLCTSSVTLFLGNITLHPTVCECHENPRLLLKGPPRPSLREQLPQGAAERFLQSNQWAVELPLTLEEAEEWMNQLAEDCMLDLSNLPQCKRVLKSLQVSLLEELLYWKSELLSADTSVPYRVKREGIQKRSVNDSLLCTIHELFLRG